MTWWAIAGFTLGLLSKVAWDDYADYKFWRSAQYLWVPNPGPITHITPTRAEISARAVLGE